MNRNRKKTDKRTHSDLRDDGYYLITRADCRCKAYVLPANPEGDTVQVDDLIVINACKDHQDLTMGGDREVDTFGFWAEELWSFITGAHYSMTGVCHMTNEVQRRLIDVYNLPEGFSMQITL